jgi:hypothetical protein
MNFDGILAWLHTQMSALLANLGDMVANHPEPARSTVIYTVVTVALAWAVVKIIKAVSK